MSTPATTANAIAADATAAELFALSDEQILEIEPEREVAPGERRVTRAETPHRAAEEMSEPAASPTTHEPPVASHGTPDTNLQSPVTNHQSPHTSLPAAVGHDAEPPPWLAAQMKDPWSGEEAREFWNGVQQARTEAAACQAYRAAIASPEDARALKELYPGGVTEARNAAQRARLLDEMDRAYFGAAENSPEQTSAARAQLAQQLLREDPAAFREMVVAGLRALEQAEKGSGASAPSDLPRLARLFAQGSEDANVAAPLTSSSTGRYVREDAGLKPGATFKSSDSLPGPEQAHLAAYAAFERAANEDLERSVGSAIERTLEQALPSAARNNASGQAGTQRVPPLQQKLGAAIRQDIEKALQGDRQLGEQVAQILASRRFDDSARAQVVRLINERAQQLVPGATKRILNDWTQTTLAAHRSRTQRNAASASHVEVAPVNAEPRSAPSPTAPGASAARRARPVMLSEAKNLSSPPSRRVDYRKFSDEQILDM